MSDKDTLGRQPTQVLEWKLPRCANVYGVAPCTAIGDPGEECFNCRNTCQDTENYREVPLGNLTPIAVNAQLDTVTGFTSGNDVTILADIAFDLEPTGVVYEAGGNIGSGIYIGFVSGNLIIRGGEGAGAPSATTVALTVDPTPYLGKRYEIIAIFNRNSGLTLDAYLFDPVERDLVYLGQDTAADTDIHGNNDFGIGTIGGGSNAGDTTVDQTDYNGFIYSVSYYDTAPDLAADDVFGRSVWLGYGDKGEPTNEQLILPCLESVSTVGSMINLAGADDDYRPLGRRATLDFRAKDFTYTDIGEDPYLANRLYDPEERSTYWIKFLERQKFGIVGSRLILHEGYAGQPLSGYLKRAYVFERVSSQSEEGVSFYARDELTRTEFLKTQIPAPSPGSLGADLTDVATSLILSGEFTTGEYPSSGTLRINDEIMTYTGKSYDGGLDETTLSGLTRGTDGSVAAEHATNDQVQLCERFTAQSPEQIIKRITQQRAGIEGQLIALAELANEQATYLTAFDSLDALVTVPTGADTLLGFLLQEVGAYGWFDERQQQIRFKAIRAIAGDDIEVTWTDEENVIFDTLTKTTKPRQRLSEVIVYYNPIDLAGDLDDEANYASALAGVAADTNYTVVQTRQIFSRFLGTLSQANQTASRLAERYIDVPTEISFVVDAKDRDVWTGDIIRLSHPLIANTLGERSVRRWLVLEAEEIDPGDKVRYKCVDITLDGSIVVITENAIGSYTAELFADGNAFITDNDGLNPDSSVGGKIT